MSDSFSARAEASILGPYRERLWNPFLQAIERYHLLEPGDRVAVCISGGKDSMLMAKLMQLMQRQGTYDFECVYLVMDPGYNAENRQKIESNAALLEIPLTIFQTEVFDIANTAGGSPCYLCARMRRGYLYSNARNAGCNKIALGHHFNDVIETTLMGLFYGAQLQAMLPKLNSTNFDGMKLIRPLYCIHEDDIIDWQHENGLEFIRCACRFTENIAEAVAHNGDSGSKRHEMKQLLRDLRRDIPDVEQHVFDSIHHLDIDTMPGWKSGGQSHSFLEKL